MTLRRKMLFEDCAQWYALCYGITNHYHICSIDSVSDLVLGEIKF
jgi:hypothetical protein